MKAVKGSYSVLVGLDEEPDSFIDDNFGSKAKLAFEAFVQSASEKTPWFFTPTELRARAWKEASVPIRHSD